MDLVYIDPPFAIGADFSCDVQAGDVMLEKKPSVIEELAYRDTWNEGIGSYCQMMWERLQLVYDLISDDGSIYLHCDPTASHYLKAIMDNIFGMENFRNEIVWERIKGAGKTSQYESKAFGNSSDSILFYGKTDDAFFDATGVTTPYDDVEESFPFTDAKGRYKRRSPFRPPGLGPRPNLCYEYKGIVPPHPSGWTVNREKLERMDADGELEWVAPDRVYRKQRVGIGIVPNNIWIDINAVGANQSHGYPTQKPEALLERIIKASSNPGDLVLDFFIGSGTTLAVAEKLGRRWIGADLGRYAIHTTRKRLLDIPDCRPFKVQNLGRYERKHWRVTEAGEAIGKYYRFILNLYGARPVQGFAHLHGERAGRMVHVGATDAPVTNAELRSAIEECVDNGLTALDVLGWEWEMGLNPAGKDELAAHYGVDTHLLNIPREVMDKGVKPGEVHFLELSVAEVAAHVDGREATLELMDFLPALDDYMREKTEGKIARWSDWIDYWSVDYEYDGETFVNQWQAYRTRREPKLALRSDPHRYAPGEYKAVAKVIDIFGNDTTCEIAVTVE